MFKNSFSSEITTNMLKMNGSEVVSVKFYIRLRYYNDFD